MNEKARDELDRMRFHAVSKAGYVRAAFALREQAAAWGHPLGHEVKHLQHLNGRTLGSRRLLRYGIAMHVTPKNTPNTSELYGAFVSKNDAIQWARHVFGPLVGKTRNDRCVIVDFRTWGDPPRKPVPAKVQDVDKPITLVPTDWPKVRTSLDGKKLGNPTTDFDAAVAAGVREAIRANPLLKVYTDDQIAAINEGIVKLYRTLQSVVDAFKHLTGLNPAVLASANETIDAILNTRAKVASIVRDVNAEPSDA